MRTWGQVAWKKKKKEMSDSSFAYNGGTPITPVDKLDDIQQIFDFDAEKSKPDIRAQCPNCWDAHKVPQTRFKYSGEQPDGKGGYHDLYNCVKCGDTQSFKSLTNGEYKNNEEEDFAFSGRLK